MTLAKTLSGVFLIMAFLLAGPGCGQKKAEPEKTGDAKAAPKEAKEHSDGPLFATADEKYHLRLKHDPLRKEARVKILDEKAKEETPIKAESITLSIKNGKPKQVELKAERPKGKDSTSLFVGSGDELAGKIDPARFEVQATIDGKAYNFELDKEHH
jgi:hypothetical protein